MVIHDETRFWLFIKILNLVSQNVDISYERDERAYLTLSGSSLENCLITRC